jgi:hypothetical protein
MTKGEKIMKGLVMAALVFFLVGGLAIAKDFEVTKKAGDYTIVVTMNKNPPTTGDNTVTISVKDGAVKRIRPKIMTVSVILAGLIPILFSHGTGADVMKRIAAPMIGGVVTSTILELIIYPAIYMIWRGREFNGGSGREILPVDLTG